MSDISKLFQDFKDDVEKIQFFEKQQTVITNLLKRNKVLSEEIEHLKELLKNSTILIASESKIERVIITPEEALIDKQISLIQERGIDREITLEDTKKLDLLLKNKNILKEQFKAIEVNKPKVDKRNFSNAQLIQIISSNKKSDGQS